MGNEISELVAPLLTSTVAICCGSILLGIVVLVILGFIIYKIYKHYKKDEYEDDKTNYEEDIIGLDRNRGKSKNYI